MITTSAVPTTVDRTRALLLAGAVAAPLWTTVSLAQAAFREGFDLTRHPLSALGNGDLGWLQNGNFVVTGVLLVLGASGLARALRGAPGGRWAPRLLRVAGLGTTAAGFLVMDPFDGFPPGTPSGAPESMSWHGIGHMVVGTALFGCLIAACYVLGHHFRRTGDRGRALASLAAGTALLAGNLWAVSGGAAGSLTLAVGAIAAMLWISAVAARLARI
jgi:hypothetical membrane protein